MTFLDAIFDLLVVFCDISYMRYWFFPLLALAFLASCPRIIRSFFEWR